MAKKQNSKTIKQTSNTFIPRPPIVTFLGHVDHGKTSILDYIRQTELQKKEEGGITQSIGAYQVEIEVEAGKRKKITFIDTPGHEAFTTMRARGGKTADIVVLVVAANAGVQPQTIEAINHAKAAKVPIIVAINKIDLPEVKTKQIINQLSKADVLVEELGGKTVSVEVSAKTGQGIKELLEMILLVAELNELKANSEVLAEGIIIESFLDKRRGPIASAIVTSGVLKTGETITTGTTWGKVKKMNDWQQNEIIKAGPSTPIEILGLKEVPQAGEKFKILPSGKPTANFKTAGRGTSQFKSTQSVSQESAESVGREKQLNLIIKADTQGSLEALDHALQNLNTDEIKIEIIHKGIGQISQADVILAATTSARVLGFRVRPDKAAENTARLEKIKILTYKIIYRLLEDISEIISTKVTEAKVQILGQAEILKVFILSDDSKVAGARVKEGTIKKGGNIRIIRNNEILHTAKLLSLKHEKEKISLAEEGTEFGVIIEPEFEFVEGDIIEQYSR